MKNTLTHQTPFPFLQGGGEMGAMIRDHNWSLTPVGPIDGWPLSLRLTIGNLLHSAFPMFLFWGDELTCFYNDAYRPSLGVSGKHPALGQSGEAVWPEIWHFIHPLIQQVLTTGEPVWFEDQYLPIERNGTLEDVYWTFSYSPAYRDDGQVYGVLVTCMETTRSVEDRHRINDIVQQRTAELQAAHNSLVQANTYLQHIINLFKQPLQILQPVFKGNEIVDFRYKLTNAAYAAYANTDPQQLENKKVSEVFPGYLQTSSFVKVAETFLTGRAQTWDIPYNVDGLDLYNEMSATKLGDEVVVHFTDFSKMKHLQLELLKKIDELERSNIHLEEFAHAASHDLKEPIRKIQVFTALLKDQLGDHLKEADRRTLERIQKATGRMNDLVDDLLLYSEVSQQPHEKEPVNLNEKLQRVLEDLELDIQQKKAEIRIGELPTVQGYRRQIQQMFQNLVSNALKYCKPDTAPQLSITADVIMENGRSYHLIEVQDNGIGFEQEYAEKIFLMFTRLHGRTEYSGTGIGLSIVKKVIENHEGMVKAESRPGEGSIFRVYLPVV